MYCSADRSRRKLLAIMLFAMAIGCMALPELLIAQEAAPAAAPAAGAPAAEPAHQESFVWWVIKTSGPIGAFLFILSTYFIATVSKLFVDIKPEKAMPPHVVEESKALVDKRDFKGVYNLVKADESQYSKLVRAGLHEMGAGVSEARGAMERTAEVIATENDKRISMLAVLGSLGPMIGLLGTLQGMIKSFSVIARSDTQLKASQVAEGISEALLLTFEGVALSVPAIYFFALFRNRISTIGANTLLAADELISKLATAVRQKPAGGAAPAGAPAAPAQ